MFRFISEEVSFMNRVSRYTIILAVAGVAALGLSACGEGSMPGIDQWQ
jgi:hypothetical protein